MSLIINSDETEVHFCFTWNWNCSCLVSCYLRLGKIDLCVEDLTVSKCVSRVPYTKYLRVCIGFTWWPQRPRFWRKLRLFKMLPRVSRQEFDCQGGICSWSCCCKHFFYAWWEHSRLMENCQIPHQCCSCVHWTFRITFFVDVHGWVQEQSIGSGTIIDPDGTIFTCAHVVADFQSTKAIVRRKVANLALSYPYMLTV